MSLKTQNHISYLLINAYHFLPERLTEEFERRLSQCESSWQQQLSTTRTTLELVKEQMRRDSYEQVQQLKTQHQRELGMLRNH